MLTLKEAKIILGFSENDTIESEKLEERYRRLRMRYPQAHFPEKFSEIITAYKALTDSSAHWNTLFDFDRLLDISWSIPYFKDGISFNTISSEVDFNNLLLQKLSQCGLKNPSINDDNFANINPELILKFLDVFKPNYCDDDDLF